MSNVDERSAYLFQETKPDAFYLPLKSKIIKVCCTYSSIVVLCEDGTVHHYETTDQEKITLVNTTWKKTISHEHKVVDIGSSHKLFSVATENNELYIYKYTVTSLEQKFHRPDLKIIQMGGGINHMLFLMEKIQTGERVVYRYGSDDLGAYGVSTSYNTPNEWIIRDFEGRKIEMLGFGGYHTLFLVSGDVYGIGYDANGEMGIPQRGNFYSMVGFPFTEPIRNKLYVCGSNEKSLLGVDDYLQQDETEQIFRIIHMKEFDHIVSEVFTGAMHWFLRTTDGTLYYSGQNYDYRATQEEEQQTNHICKTKSRGHLVVCDRFASKDMKFALGNQITVMYMGAKEETLFSTQFVQSLLNGGEKATTHANVLIFCY